MLPPKRFPHSSPLASAPQPYRPVQPAGFPIQQNIQLTPAQRIGGNAYRITATGGVGSVMVHDRDRRSIEITDLKVQEQHRKHGFGGALIASALREGVRMGKTEVVLTAQDSGRGTLTRWYSEMGFTQTGRSIQGYPMMSAPIGRVLSTLSRRPAGVTPNSARPTTPPKYVPPVQARMAQPKSSLPFISNRGILNRTIQRMEASCDWCSIHGCHKGSICKGSGSNPGIYKGRTQDQKYLSNRFGQTVSGDTHQMEHPFGYDVLAHPLHVKRGSTPLAQQIEDEAPAYHEEKPQHRKHEGTGNIKKYPRESGLNAPQYRSWQRTALQDNNPDIAMAVNQMTYGHQKLEHDKIAQAQAWDSFIRMVKNMGKIPWANDSGQFEYLDPPTADMKFDMIVYRFMTIFKRPPNEDEQMGIIKTLGISPSWL